MKIKKLIAVLSLLLLTCAGWAQKKDSVGNTSVFERKKLYWGVSYTQSWSVFKGEREFEPYFTKPSVGGNVFVEYFPVKFAGLRVGGGYMQRGTGIKLPDNDKSLGDPDSTYRTRLRFNTIEFPIALVLRTPKDIIKGIRLAGGVGVTPYINFETNRFYDSAEDGFHPIEGQSNMYLKNDLPLHVFLGTHINMANYSLFYVELFMIRGTKNVYKDDSFGDADARHRSWGIRVTWMY